MLLSSSVTIVGMLADSAVNELRSRPVVVPCTLGQCMDFDLGSAFRFPTRHVRHNGFHRLMWIFRAALHLLRRDQNLSGTMLPTPRLWLATAGRSCVSDNLIHADILVLGSALPLTVWLVVKDCSG